MDLGVGIQRALPAAGAAVTDRRERITRKGGKETDDMVVFFFGVYNLLMHLLFGMVCLEED